MAILSRAIRTSRHGFICFIDVNGVCFLLGFPPPFPALDAGTRVNTVEVIALLSLHRGTAELSGSYEE